MVNFIQLFRRTANDMFKSLVFDAELGNIKYWTSEMINFSSGDVVLQAAGEVLVCGSPVSGVFSVF